MSDLETIKQTNLRLFLALPCHYIRQMAAPCSAARFDVAGTTQERQFAVT